MKSRLYFLWCFFILGFVGCGVKGKPMPPLQPAPLGRGEPTFSKSAEDLRKKKANQKKAYPDDWQESDDFESGE